ncbi:unnamed protein product [Bursaphelenchus xylophilus]|uniref:protein-tyrosine-phosphatase n=1 Tax=Bursaphelenchus xylophilus TaxID=6326 RepID=A0A1I7SLX9_BURXY|nr:unnamed protein product [Bursaphelenchus xylophilus]CAG9129915.1 unnamed protein product [Bursaphelenchus xylophilus]
MIDHILDGIHLSDAISVIGATQRKKLEDLRIQRVLTVSAMSIDDSKKINGIHYKFIFMMDMPTQDILGDNVLEEAVAYIENAVKDGVNILVHCEMGTSRCVTVVCAYLMRRFEWSPNKALLFLKERRPNVQPNTGFMRQLEIFAHLGYKADPQSLTVSPLYRNFCADTGNVPKLQPCSPIIDSASTSISDPQAPINIPKASLDHKSPEGMAAQLKFRCRKCRADLFYDTHVLYHGRGRSGTTGEAMTENDEKKLRKAFSLGDNRCNFEYFITPMKWMDADQFQGKINCPKCSEKLGQYIWGGRKCLGSDDLRCGTHVSPWFYIQKCQVDKIRVGGDLSLPANMAVPSVVIS